MVRGSEADRAEWAKAENWSTGPRWLSVYFSHADTRIWVPKRIPTMGWTLNLAKAGGVAWLIGFLVGPPVVAVVLITLICTRHLA